MIECAQNEVSFKKLHLSRYLVALLSISLLLTSLLSFGLAQSGTNVGGMISLDTTWTLSSSPYYVTSPIIVPNGITLTIEPGVTVDLGSYSLQVNGILNAIGTNNSIVFVSSGFGNIIFSASSQCWNELSDTGCIMENVALHSVTISTRSASPKISNCHITPSYNAIDGSAIYITSGSPAICGNTIFGNIGMLNDAMPSITNNHIIGGILATGFLTSTPMIENNTIEQGITQTSYLGIGILASGSYNYISGNTISGCKTGIDVYDGTSVIERNLIAGNNIGISFTSPMSPVSATIQHNLILNNTVGLDTVGKLAAVSISYNNIVNNSQYSLSISVASNWWGTTDQVNIAKIISVNFVPFLTSPDTKAPTLPSSASFPTPKPNPSLIPTPTVTPSPTSTPTPTPTSTPTNIPTPQPSSTPTPNQTSIPTSTPKPIATPNSSGNPTPIPTTPLTPNITQTPTAILNIAKSIEPQPPFDTAITVIATIVACALVAFVLLIKAKKKQTIKLANI